MHSCVKNLLAPFEVIDKQRGMQFQWTGHFELIPDTPGYSLRPRLESTVIAYQEVYF